MSDFDPFSGVLNAAILYGWTWMAYDVGRQGGSFFPISFTTNLGRKPTTLAVGGCQ